jgi:NarL family two-component system response regulator LiaR
MAFLAWCCAELAAAGTRVGVLVGEAHSGRDALDLCATMRPDVVLMDLVMPEMNGAVATQAIRQAHPQTQVIALTSFHVGDLVTEALQAGRPVQSGT